MNRKTQRPSDAIETKPSETKQKPQVTWPVVAFQFSMLLDKVADKFGICAVVLFLVVGVVWLFGDSKTENDFVRELLFQEVTHTPYLSVLIVLLLGGIVATGWAKQWKRSGKNSEMERIVKERNELQQMQLNVPIESSGEVSK